MEIRIELKGLNELRSKFEKAPEDARKAISRTINDGIRKARTEIKKAIGHHYNLSPSAILSELKKEFPAYSTPSSLFGLLHIESNKVPVMDFKAVDLNPAGVRFEEVRGKYSGLPHAFVAGFRSGHQGVFGRIDGSARLRIREITGLSIPQMLEKPEVETNWEETTGAYVQERLEHNVSHLLG